MKSHEWSLNSKLPEKIEDNGQKVAFTKQFMDMESLQWK